MFRSLPHYWSQFALRIQDMIDLLVRVMVPIEHSLQKIWTHISKPFLMRQPFRRMSKDCRRHDPWSMKKNLKTLFILSASSPSIPSMCVKFSTSPSCGRESLVSCMLPPLSKNILAINSGILAMRFMASVRKSPVVSDAPRASIPIDNQSIDVQSQELVIQVHVKPQSACFLHGGQAPP